MDVSVCENTDCILCITVIPLIIVAWPLGEGNFVNVALVATITHKNFPFRLPTATICCVHCRSICTHLFSFDNWVLWGSIVVFILVSKLNHSYRMNTLRLIASIWQKKGQAFHFSNFVWRSSAKRLKCSVILVSRGPFKPLSLLNVWEKLHPIWLTFY